MNYEMQARQWLANRGEEADAADAVLKDLKRNARLAAEVVDAAEGHDVIPALRAQNEANFALMLYLANKRN